MKKKSELPSKLCECCQRPFAWRKKWERDWEQVKYCSDRCRQTGVKGTAAPSASASSLPNKGQR